MCNVHEGARSRLELKNFERKISSIKGVLKHVYKSNTPDELNCQLLRCIFVPRATIVLVVQWRIQGDAMPPLAYSNFFCP